MDGSYFTFLGFVPRKVDQKKVFFERLRVEDRTALFLETPSRVKATLRVASRVLGPRRIILWREITKIHEEILSGTAEAILAELEKRPSVKGEIIILIEGLTRPEPTMDVAEAVSILMAEGFTGKRLADEAHKRFGLKKGNAYAAFLAMRADR
jgi:16S rRNA (cytidine1402-2'-O)-methyltransferase